MLISDWSSDVCSSDLAGERRRNRRPRHGVEGRRVSDLRVELLPRHVAVMAPVQPAHQRLVRHVVVLRIPLAYFLQGDRHQRTPSGSLRGANRGASDAGGAAIGPAPKSEEHTCELQTLMRHSISGLFLETKTKSEI